VKGAESLGYWVAENPIIIIAAAVLLTIVSLHYAQQIEMQGMTTESMVGKDSPLYQLYDHLYVEKFGTESIAVLIEGDNIKRPEILKSTLMLSDKMKEAPDVLRVVSIADIVADAEASQTGVRGIPAQERIDQILNNPEIIATAKILMPDKKHTMLSIEMPVSLSEKQLGELFTETNGQVKMANFPADVGVTVTGRPALMKSITAEMANSNGPVLALAGLLMIVALLVAFRHVKWPLLPIPVVFLGVTWTFGAMGFLHIPFTMVSMSAFPVLVGIGIDYAIQFHNRLDEEFSRGTAPIKAVVETISHVSVPVMIALIITATGFVSLLTSSVPMTRDFGLTCLIGLFLCYLSALFVGNTALLYRAERIFQEKCQRNKRCCCFAKGDIHRPHLRKGSRILHSEVAPRPGSRPLAFLGRDLCRYAGSSGHGFQELHTARPPSASGFQAYERCLRRDGFHQAPCPVGRHHQSQDAAVDGRIFHISYRLPKSD